MQEKNKFDENGMPIFSKAENMLLNVVCYGGWLLLCLFCLAVFFGFISAIVSVIFRFIGESSVYQFASSKPILFAFMVVIMLPLIHGLVICIAQGPGGELQKDKQQNPEKK